MQPHYPFIGETGQQISEQGGIEFSIRRINGERGDWEAPTVWEQLAKNHISEQTVWKAYKENLELVVKTVEELHEKIDGWTAITSDHGNYAGEIQLPIPVRRYGHPENTRSLAVTNVPWLVLRDRRHRRNIREGEKIGNQQSEGNDEVEERLKNLGYH